MLLSLIFCFAWFAFADSSETEVGTDCYNRCRQAGGDFFECSSDCETETEVGTDCYNRCRQAGGDFFECSSDCETEALAAESQEKAVAGSSSGNWGAIRCYKRCRRVGGTVSNCHAACPSNTETKVAGDTSETLAAESQEKAVAGDLPDFAKLRCYKRCRNFGGSKSTCEADCDNTEAEQDLSNPLPEEVKTGSGTSSCYKKQVKTACAYTVGSLSIDNGKAYSVTDEAKCKQVCDTSSDCVAFEYIHSGQHSGGPMKLGTGTCYYYGGTVVGTAKDKDRTCYVKKECHDSSDSNWRRVAVGVHCLPNDWCGQTECTNHASQGVATWGAFAKHVSSESGSACLERVSADNDCGEYAFFKAGYCFCTRASGSNDCVRTATWAGAYEVHTRDAELALESEQVLSNPSPEEFTSNALAESSVSQTTKLPAIVTYVFAAIGFLSVLYVGAKHASKALSRSDYAEV